MNAGRLTEARGTPPGRVPHTGPFSIYVGHLALRKVAYIGAGLTLPEWADPFAFRWPVRGRDITLSWPRGRLAEVRRFYDALLEDGAARIVVIDPIYLDSAQPEPWRWVE